MRNVKKHHDEGLKIIENNYRHDLVYSEMQQMYEIAKEQDPNALIFEAMSHNNDPNTGRSSKVR